MEKPLFAFLRQNSKNLQIKEASKHAHPDYSLLQESLKNEKAFLWYSIIATVITVSMC